MLDPVYCRQCKQLIDPTDPFCKLCGADQRSGAKPAVPQIVILQPERSSIHIIATIAAVAATLIFGTAGYLYVRDSDAMNPDRARKSVSKSPAPAPSATMPMSTQGRTQTAPQDRQQSSQPMQPPAGNPAPPQDAQNVQPATSLGPEPSPRAPVQMQGHVHIGDAHVSVENDGNGHEQCVGRVLIINDGPYAVTDFRLGLKVLSGEYALTPFGGSLQFPTSIIVRRIEPGGSMDVPVMTTGVYTSFSVYGMKSITLDASIDGPPGFVTDEKSML